MTRCPECGWEIDPEDEMCPNCGAFLADYEDVDLSARFSSGFALVALGVQERGIADHARGVERHLESKRQLEPPRREVAGPSAQDLPEVVPPQVPGSTFVGPGPGEHARIARRRVDLEHVEGQIDAFHRGDPRGLP